MLRSGVWALLILAAAGPADDREAQGILKGLQQRIEQARTLRVEGRLAAEGEEGAWETSFSIRIRGADHWAIDVRQIRGPRDSVQGVNILAVCDGRRIVLAGAAPDASIVRLLPGEGGRILRGLLGTAGLSELETWMHADPGDSAVLPAAGKVKDGGPARVGDLEARLIEFTVSEGVNVRLFLSPSSKDIVRREWIRSGVKMVETYTAFAVDEDLPDSEFVFLSARRLGRVRAAELARSVALYGTFTGRYPRTLDDLAHRPADLDPEFFFPDGGFVLGGVVPQDPWGRPYELQTDQGRVRVVGLGADGKPGGTGDAEDSQVVVPVATRRAVGAPSDRLRQYYSARVQIQLLAGAVRLYRDATGGLPRKKADLWEKPADAAVWPEGGFLPGGRLPLDPWGRAYRIISDPDHVRVQAWDPQEHPLSVKALSPEETRALEATARPRLSDDERRAVRGLLDRLSEDDLDAREKAEQELKAWGPALHGELEERLKTEKDAETRLRIEAIRKAVPARRPSWAKELAPLVMTIRALDELQGDQAALTSCANNLSQLWKMQQVYASQFGRRMKKMPDATGKEFWLALSKTQPPLIDSTVSDIYICPASGLKAGDNICSYRGPAKNVAQLADGDVVGMCDDEGHGDSVVILRKSGDVIVISRADAGYEEALEKTKP